MNGNNALLDSNILIYLSKNELPFSILDQFAALFISVISYMEVLGYRFSNSKEEILLKNWSLCLTFGLLIKRLLKM
ncbi:MAG: hypothetical protein SRB1_02046 [Desulfobacteraceae bacterium Eth-SRB1]|nr:MAG: hypothetical protein SRB1_02046 [Desulfobacteraceae bacterium Eth-SRB1]